MACGYFFPGCHAAVWDDDRRECVYPACYHHVSHCDGSQDHRKDLRYAKRSVCHCHDDPGRVTGVSAGQWISSVIWVCSGNLCCIRKDLRSRRSKEERYESFL